MAELIAELVGFVVMLFVLWKYVLPPVGTMVRKRQDEVQRQVDEAEEATRKLEDARGRLDNAVQRAEAEGARIRDDARAEATRIREELKEQAEAEVERMLQRGREQLVADRDQAVRRLRADLGDASMELAERVIRTTLERSGSTFKASASCVVSAVAASDVLSSSQEPASIRETAGSSRCSHSMVNSRSFSTRSARSFSEAPAASRSPSTVMSTVPDWSNTSRSASHSPTRDAVTRVRQ